MKILVYKFILLPVLILISYENSMAQHYSEIVDSTNRKVFSTITVGVIEGLSFTLGYQINDNYSIAVKNQYISVSGGILNSAWGIGLTGSFYFSSQLFNSVKLSIIPLFKTTHSDQPQGLIKGYSVECTINRENILSQVFRFYYELGMAYSKVRDRDVLLAPSVKIGILYNF